MASQVVTLKVAGLHTYFQSLMEIPPGALLKANNIVINRDGVGESRRGIKAYGNPFGTSVSRSKQLIEYKGRILHHYDTSLLYDDGTGNFTTFSGSYSEPTAGYRIKSTEAKSNLYFTTSEGVKKISASSAVDLSIANIIQDAGAPKAITGSVKVNYSVDGFLPAMDRTAYKIMWTYTDRNQNLLFGSPSARMVADNQSLINDTSVDLTFQIPHNVTSNSFRYRIYRSEASTTPSDELFQVFEGTPTPAELVSRTIVYTDSLAEDLRVGGVPLYTNEFSGEGILKANEPPPSALDIALFKGHLFYGNTRTRHTSIFNLIDPTGFTSGVSDIVVSDGVTTNTYVFYGAKEKSQVTVTLNHAGTIPGSYFLISSAGNARKYKVWLDKTGTDTEPTVAGTIAVRVNLSGGGISTTTDVAVAIKNAINAITSGDFAATNLANVLTIENTNNGISDNTVDGTTTYTFSTLVNGLGEDLATQKILISANPDRNLAIEEMAHSLVRAINANSLEIVVAFYASNFGETPGRIILQRKTLVDSSVALGTNTVAIADKFNPSLGSGLTLLTKLVTTAETIGNRLYFSKYQESEAVPLLNFIDVGTRDQDILRIIPLRESLFILKGDGVFRLAGDPGANPNWDVGVFDNTSIIKAPDTAVTLGNNCYYFSNQGIVRLNESTLEPISRPIEEKLLPFISTNPNLRTASFAVAYESDRALLVWTVLKKTDSYATVCYRYNTYTNTWTEWIIPKTCAVLNVQQDKLYFGSGSDNYVEVERKGFDRWDYADRELPSGISTGGLIGVTAKPSNFTAISIEDVLLQEQYVTIFQYNTLLRKLDLDNGLLIHSFYDDLAISQTDNLTSKMSSLVAKLNLADTNSFLDTNGNTSYVFSGATSFSVIQQEFNEIIQRLNQSPTTYFSSYTESTGTIKYEAIVMGLDTIAKEVTLNVEPAFLIGPLSIFKGIPKEIEYAPQHAGDPAGQKQFSSGTFMFERRSFFTAQAAYNSDISDHYEEVRFTPNSAGVFGGATWGDGTIWGGLGDQSQIRTYIPLKKQRCRFLGCKFSHGVALENFELYGLSLSVRAYAIADRDYK